MHGKPEITCLISIDTEEEWDWAGDFPTELANVANIQELPAFQALCHGLGLRPTYFCDYAVLDNDPACAVLKRIYDSGQAEIAAHLHPWVNPPFFETTNEFRSHVVNLPIEQVDAKLALLTDKIEQKIGQRPLSFRTGRWGINQPIFELLEKYGYLFDSSIYPLYYHRYFDCSTAGVTRYFPRYVSPNDVEPQPSRQHILEIPVSTGFNRGNARWANPLHQLLSQKPFSWFRFNGLLWQIGWLRKLYLSPELCTADEMLVLAKKLIASGVDTLHIYLHSSSLLDGANEMSAPRHARESIGATLSQFMRQLQQEYNIKGKTLSEYGADERGG